MSSQPRASGFIVPVACILLGSIGALVTWGESSEDKTQLTRKLMEFQDLSVEQQSAIRKSYALLKSQPQSRQSEIAAIFEQAQKDPDLRKTLDQFFTWWSGLSQNEWDSFQELNDSDKVAFVRSRWERHELSNKDITVESSGPASVRMPTLHISFDEYWTIISSAIPESARDDVLRKELESLSSNKHRALRLTLYYFECFQDERKLKELEMHGELFRDAMLKTVRNEAWIQKFRSMTQELDKKPFARPWMFMTLFTVLDKATLALGDDLRKQFPVTTEQKVEAFASLQKSSEEDRSLQRSLMTMSANEARRKLELLAQSTMNDTPEEQLLARYNRFTQKRTSYLRGPFGFGGAGADRSRPPEEGSRPQRDQTRRSPNK